MHLGEIIKQYRQQNNLSMQSFADKCGVSKAYISMLERNQNSTSKKPIIPSIVTLKAVANVMNIELDDLLKSLDDEQLIDTNTKSAPADPQQSESELTQKNERDIQKRLNDILSDLESDAALSFYNGDEPLDEETLALLKASLENSITVAKLKAKKKFNPNKNKKQG